VKSPAGRRFGPPMVPLGMNFRQLAEIDEMGRATRVGWQANSRAGATI